MVNEQATRPFGGKKFNRCECTHRRTCKADTREGSDSSKSFTATDGMPSCLKHETGLTFGFSTHRSAAGNYTTGFVDVFLQRLKAPLEGGMWLALTPSPNKECP